MDIIVTGISEKISLENAAVFRSRVISAYKNLINGNGDLLTSITVTPKKILQQKSKAQKQNINGDANETSKFKSIKPAYTFNRLILPDVTFSIIKRAIELLRLEYLVFDEWGLREIEPNPKTAFNFHGPPGTGKTMAAHAIADYLGKNIIVASYAEIESKYHGDGPKNVKLLFQTAEENDAILFIDEADSLLSKRLTNVTQGSEQAINSMRSQLLINLEQYHGIVIFATNLVQNYDKAFETRVQNIRFLMPDKHCRKEIWQNHFPSGLPVSADVSAEQLAEKIEDICGRDIKNAVIQAALEAALENKVINQQMLVSHINQIKQSKMATVFAQPEPIELTERERLKFEGKVKAAFRER